MGPTQQTVGAGKAGPDLAWAFGKEALQKLPGGGVVYGGI